MAARPETQRTHQPGGCRCEKAVGTTAGRAEHCKPSTFGPCRPQRSVRPRQAMLGWGSGQPANPAGARLGSLPGTPGGGPSKSSPTTVAGNARRMGGTVRNKASGIPRSTANRRANNGDVAASVWVPECQHHSGIQSQATALQCNICHSMR